MTILLKFSSIAVALALLTSTQCLPAQPVRLSPAGQAAFNFGLAAVQQHNWKIAIRYFLDAQKIDPTSSQVWFNLGLACAKQPGYEFRAIAWFKAYLIANPNASNAKAIQAQIMQLEIAYEARLSNLLDPLESVARTLLVSDSIAPDPWAASSLGSRLAAMRLDLGDTTGAERTLTVFSVTPLYGVHQNIAAKSLDETALISLGRDGYGSSQFNADFDDTSLDTYIVALKQELLASTSTLSADKLEPTIVGLDRLFDTYRKLRGLYGSVEVTGPNPEILGNALSRQTTYVWWEPGKWGNVNNTDTATVHFSGCTFSISTSEIGTQHIDGLWSGDLGSVDPTTVQAWKVTNTAQFNYDREFWDFGFGLKAGAPPFTYQGYRGNPDNSGTWVSFVTGIDMTSLVAPMRALIQNCTHS